MTVLPILIHPNPILTTRAEEVQTIDAEIKQLAADMQETLIATQGVGLAANQVGSLHRVVLINATYCAEVDGAAIVNATGIITMINPTFDIIDNDIQPHREGCLSIPHVFMDVARPSGILLTYTDLNGKEIKLTTQYGLFNAAIQHEIDHLDGIMFPDKLSNFQRRRAWKKLDKERKTLPETINYPFTP